MLAQSTRLLSLSETNDLVIGLISGDRAVLEPYLDEIEAMLSQRYGKPVLLLLVTVG